MTQSNKSQADKTTNQLKEGIRKSKAAGSTPGGTAASAPPAIKKAAPRAAQGKRATTNQYALGGLRWPD
jgi:hypothetical protein